jgi:hypothetical protein
MEETEFKRKTAEDKKNPWVLVKHTSINPGSMQKHAGE